MTDSKEERAERERDDLDLDAETIKDLEPSEQDGEGVKGGAPRCSGLDSGCAAT